MINKIYSTLTDNNDNNNSSNDNNTIDKSEKVYEDCLPCKVTGALGFGGLGAYALREATVVNKMPGRVKTATGLSVAGVVFISAGLYRLTM